MWTNATLKTLCSFVYAIIVIAQTIKGERPMNAKVENGNLVITLPLQKPTRSKTGKSLIIASTNGFMKTGVEVEGKEISLSVNAIVKG